MSFQLRLPENIMLKRLLRSKSVPSEPINPVVKVDQDTQTEEEDPVSIDPVSNPDISVELVPLIIKKINDKSFCNDNEVKKNVLQIMLNHFPETIQDIEKQINVILKDKKIDAFDIPPLILLIKDIVNLNTNGFSQLKITRNEIIEFIEDILVITINNLDITKEDKLLYVDFIGKTTALLETSIVGIEEISCFSCSWFQSKAR